MDENSKNFLTFSFKLILFTSVIGFILVIFILPGFPEIGSSRSYAFELNKLEENSGNSFDFALFGNSYVYTAYDPSILKSNLGLKSIHVNSASQILETSLILAQHVVKKNDFKYVLFDVSENSILRPEIENEKSWYYQTVALQKIPFSYDKFKRVNNFFPRKNYIEYYSASISENAGKLFRLNKRADYMFNRPEPKYYHFSGALFSENGYFAYDHRVKSLEENVFVNEYNKGPRKKANIDTLWNMDLKRSMIDFIEKAQSKKIEVILVNSLKLRKSMYNVEFIDSLKKKYDNVNFLNFNEEREGYNLNGKCFFDSSHLTYLGSYQVTHRLVDSLSQWYNIPKKEGNQVNYKYLNLLNYSYNLIDDQDKFIKLEFDSIPALIKDHKLAVYLYPKDSTLLSEYSKEKNFKSDSFYIDLDDSSSIKLGESVVFIDRLKTNITEKTLDRIKVFFYKPNDTLKLQSFTIKPDDLKNQ